MKINLTVHNPNKAIVPVFLCLALSLAPTTLNGFSYDLGFSCKSMGSWTQNAIGQTQKLIAAIESLKANENCVGIESFLGGLSEAQSSLNELDQDQQGQQAAEIQSRKQNINSFLNDLPDHNQLPTNFLNYVAGLHIDSAIGQVASFTSKLTEDNMNPFRSPSKRSKVAQSLSSLLSKSMSLMPSLETCLVNAPNQAIALLSSIINLSASITNLESDGNSSHLAGVIANFVSFVRDSRFAMVMKDLNQNELWSSIACALESTTQNYCQVKDNLKLLEWSVDQISPGASVSQESVASTSPIAGYYVLIRNVPTISEWLLKVQFGVNPKLVTDSTFKNNIWQTTTSMIQSTNILLGTLNESRLTLELLGDDVAKKSETFNLITKLAKAMRESVYESGSSMVNFFTVSMPANLLPLFLIGIDIKDTPQEVKPNNEGKFVMGVEQWIQNMGDYRPMFDDPEKLLSIIEIRLKSLIDRALRETTKFFIRRLIVDMPNLVAEAYVHNSLNTSVVDSLDFVSEYLIKLKHRISHSPYGSYQMIPIINQTLVKIQQIRTAFAVQLEPDVLKTSTTSEQARLIIETVYESFNVLLQRDSFLTNRMATFVFYDYYLQIAEGTNFNQYEQDLLVISNLEMLQRILQVNQTEPAINKEDFQTALMLNRRNIDALENLFRDNFFQYIQLLDDEARNRPIWRRNMRALKRLNSEVPEIIRYTPVAYLYQLGDYFFGNSYKYRYIFNNPFNPYYLRGDNEHHSFLNTRNRLCIQLLAFQNPTIFHEFCQEANLVSPFFNQKTTTDLTHLNARFADFATKDHIIRAHDDRVCAYRDYLRRNNVFWLTLQHEEIKKKRLERLKSH